MWTGSVRTIVSSLASAAAPFTVVTELVAGEAASQDPAPITSRMVTPAAKQIPWSTANSKSLRALFSDTRVVKKFLNELEAAGDPGDPGVIVDVQEYLFLDLNSDDSLELIALADVSGRAFFNNVIVVYQTSDAPVPSKPLEIEYEGFVLRDVHGFDIRSLDSALKDLDNDGVYEIVVNEPLEPDQGPTKARAVLPEIYKWNGRDYDKASSKYGWYYLQVVLPALEHELQKLEALPEPNANAERAELRARRETYLREIAEARKRAPQK